MTDPEPADLALEMRAVKFMLDYKCAKRTEYDRLRRAELRVEKNLRKSRLRRKFKSVAHKVGPDEPPSRDEIDVSAPRYSPLPFTDFMASVPSVQSSKPHEVGFRDHLRGHDSLLRMERKAILDSTRYAEPTVAGQRLHPAYTTTLRAYRLRWSSQKGAWAATVQVA